MSAAVWPERAPWACVNVSWRRAGAVQAKSGLELVHAARVELVPAHKGGAAARFGGNGT